MGADQGAGPPKRDRLYYGDPVDYTLETMQAKIDQLHLQLELADAENARLKELLVETDENLRLTLVHARELKEELTELRAERRRSIDWMKRSAKAIRDGH